MPALLQICISLSDGEGYRLLGVLSDGEGYPLLGVLVTEKATDSLVSG